MYCVDVKGDQVEGKASLSVSQPVSHLASSLDNAKLIVATETVTTHKLHTRILFSYAVLTLGLYICC